MTNVKKEIDKLIDHSFCTLWNNNSAGPVAFRSIGLLVHRVDYIIIKTTSTQLIEKISGEINTKIDSTKDTPR